MRILLCGGTQDASQRCVRVLLERGHEVSVLTENPRTLEHCRRLGADLVTGSLYQLASLEAGLAGRDVVIFFGTDMPLKLLPSRADLQPYDRLRRDGTRNLVSGVVRQRVPFLVLVSSIVVYGDRGDRLVTEETPLDPPAAAHSFADMEEIIDQAREFQGLRSVTLRTGLVYSADDWHTRSLFSELARGKIPPLAGERGYVSPVHAEDLARAVAAAVEKAPAGTTVNVADDNPVRLCELLQGAARAMQVKAPGALPSFVIRLYMGKDLYRLLQTSCRASNERAKELLGWTPRFPSILEQLDEEVAIWRDTHAQRHTTGRPARTEEA